MAMPRTVFTSTSVSAPASNAAPAMSTMSGTLGLSFTHSGNPHAVDAATA
jgi:hypothetical protein